ncbi:hypothetical protein Ait01nite_097370 [Actinoplanes italicus]|nr:hypothetical protein Ait01nite_097370 [Actinoplanes italicus]
MPGGQFTGSVPGGERLLVSGAVDKPTQTLVDTATGRTIAPAGSGSLLSVDQQKGTALLLRHIDPATSALSRIVTATGRKSTAGPSGSPRSRCRKCAGSAALPAKARPRARRRRSAKVVVVTVAWVAVCLNGRSLRSGGPHRQRRWRQRIAWWNASVGFDRS